MAHKIKTALFHRRGQEASLPHVGVVKFDAYGHAELEETPEAEALLARTDLADFGIEVVTEDETEQTGELPTDPEELKKALLGMRMDAVKEMLKLAGHPESEYKHLKQNGLAEYAVSKLTAAPAPQDAE